MKTELPCWRVNTPRLFLMVEKGVSWTGPWVRVRKAVVENAMAPRASETTTTQRHRVVDMIVACEFCGGVCRLLLWNGGDVADGADASIANSLLDVTCWHAQFSEGAGGRGDSRISATSGEQIQASSLVSEAESAGELNRSRFSLEMSLAALEMGADLVGPLASRLGLCMCMCMDELPWVTWSFLEGGRFAGVEALRFVSDLLVGLSVPQEQLFEVGSPVILRLLAVGQTINIIRFSQLAQLIVELELSLQ